MITSRFRLNIQSEYLLPVAGLDSRVLSLLDERETTHCRSKESFSPVRRASIGSSLIQDAARDAEIDTEYCSVKLFTYGVCQVRPGFKPTIDELKDIVCICRLLQGMPLALLLAAAWAKILTPAEILAHLSNGDSDSLDFLAADWADMPTRHCSIRAIFDQSWNLLSERERDVLAALSVFRGGFTHQAAQTVSGASLRVLMALVDKSMLNWTHEGGYKIFEMLRRYAAEKLEQVTVASADDCDRHRLIFAGA